MGPIDRRGLIALGAALCLAGPARAGAETVAIHAVRAPGDIVLADGRVLTPLGLAPTPGLAAELAGHLAGRRVAARARARDRHGRHAAWIEIEGVSLSHALLRQGVAWAWPFGVGEADWPALIAAEDAARGARRGLWRAGAALLPIPAAEATAAIGAPALVAGRVARVDRRGGWVHLDFGTDWRRDFTAFYRERARDRFAPRDGAAEDLRGRAVEVRGLPIWRFGPAIELRLTGQMRLTY